MTSVNKKTSAKAKRPDPMRDLVANAVDFLTLATEEFKQRPKHSIIAFHSAVELILKARLMDEHWSLVVSKSPDLTSFESGDFVSITFEEGCQRLAKIVGSPLPDRVRVTFDVIRKHRNKMVHFFQDIDDPMVREQIAMEQLNAWHALVGLITSQWRDVFDRFQLDIGALDGRFAEHRLYLQTRFNSLADKIADLKSEGKVLAACDRCGFEAAETAIVLHELHSAKCHVCNFAPHWLALECTHCLAVFRAEGDETSTCEACDTVFDASDIAELVDGDPVTTDNYFDRVTPANCIRCDGHQTVVSFHDHYLCTGCLELTDHISACGWCGEGSNGDMEGSEWKGCNYCDGRKGWDRD